jgi:hypothetical protein
LLEPYDVDNSTVAHREHLPAGRLAAPLPLSPGPSHYEPDEDAIPENGDLGHLGSCARVLPALVPGENLLSTLAGR